LWDQIKADFPQLLKLGSKLEVQIGDSIFTVAINSREEVVEVFKNEVTMYRLDPEVEQRTLTGTPIFELDGARHLISRTPLASASTEVSEVPIR